MHASALTCQTKYIEQSWFYPLLFMNSVEKRAVRWQIPPSNPCVPSRQQTSGDAYHVIVAIGQKSHGTVYSADPPPSHVNGSFSCRLILFY